MSNPADPGRSIPVQHQYSSVAPGRDETPNAPPSPGVPDTPRFGPASAVGDVGVLGPYRIIKELGRGGMGVVYLAIDTRLGRELAMKVMLPACAANAESKERFLREARAVARISHDNVVTVFEADERDGVPYFTMQLLRGSSLDESLKTKGPPPLPHVLRIAHEAALGLSAAHALGLIHRDIKPANLWLEVPDGRVKVLDFGLARGVDAEIELTKTGAVVGTPAYMSPEQARGRKVDARTDLFSLGAVLYRLCTGKPPFNGPNVTAVLMALGTEEPTPVRKLNPNVPAALAALIHQLLSKKPDDRPRTAAEVATRARAMLEQPAFPAVAAPAVSQGSAAHVPKSRPVVAHPVPVQRSLVVPRKNTRADPDEPYALEIDAPELGRKGAGGKGLLLGAVVAVLLATVAGAVVVSRTDLPNEQDDDAPEGGTPGAPPSGPDRPPPAPPLGALPAAWKNRLGMEFVLVPRGKSWLGGGGGKPGEKEVEFGQDFYLGKYAVTQDEWEKVMGNNPSHFSRTGPGKAAVKAVPDADLKRFPVETVSWDECQEFLKKLNEREKESGWVYRLPKESEWEYACRGGPVDKRDSAFNYYFAKPTNALRSEQANFTPGPGQGLGRPCKVGSYEPNSLGLYDIHGNVRQWCDDTWATGASGRVNRGSGWGDGGTSCRAGYRGWNGPSFRYGDIGLRVARVPSAPAGK